MPPSEQDGLVGRLTRYPLDRYPVQHATTQFHLGSVLLQAGQVPSALRALQAAHAVFSGAGMRLETAKTAVMVGVALRESGRLEDAAETFRVAAEELRELDQPTEQAAATYDLGLVLQADGDHAGAQQAWAAARELFLAAGYPGQAAAAARDHGASLLSAGDAAGALPLLVEAASLAQRGGDDVGTAAAANVLGLTHLALGDGGSAVAVLRRALGFAPRTTRPADHAMVKANLSLALEQTGEPARARLAAAQALVVPGAAAPVRAQAAELLTRLGGPQPGDLASVLEVEERDQWPAVVREEVVRVLERGPAERRRLMLELVDVLLARPGTSYDLAEALLQVVLELPPRPYGQGLTALVEVCGALDEEQAERLRSVVGSAMSRFAIPQWQRLSASLNAASAEAGQPATWR